MTSLAAGRRGQWLLRLRRRCSGRSSRCWRRGPAGGAAAGRGWSLLMVVLAAGVGARARSRWSAVVVLLVVVVSWAAGSTTGCTRWALVAAAALLACHLAALLASYGPDALPLDPALAAAVGAPRRRWCCSPRRSCGLPAPAGARAAGAGRRVGASGWSSALSVAVVAAAVAAGRDARRRSGVSAVRIDRRGVRRAGAAAASSRSRAAG